MYDVFREVLSPYSTYWPLINEITTIFWNILGNEYFDRVHNGRKISVEKRLKGLGN